MANFKRGKCRRKVRCCICTPYRNGNSFLQRDVQRQNQADRIDSRDHRSL